MMPRTQLRRVALVALCVALVGCGGVLVPATPDPLLPGVVAPAEAERLRASYGLRADHGYVAALYEDSQAVARGQMSDYGFPLTAIELDQLEARAKATQQLIDAIEAYGEGVPDEWAGAYIDPSRHEVVGLFTGRIEEHRAALDRIVHPQARYRLQQVRWSDAQLRRIATRIRVNTQWFETIEAIYEASGVDTLANVAHVFVRTQNPDAEALILDEFRAHGMLRVDISSVMPWEGGQGALIVFARHRDGRPVQDVDCLVTPRIPVPWSEDGRSTGDEGRCRFRRMDAIPVEIVLMPVGGPVLGRTNVTVVADDTLVVTITVADASPAP